MLGHPYGPNAERGMFRSTDGGATFQKVLYKDENTGAIDVVVRSRRTPDIDLRGAVGGAAGPVGERRVQRARQRPLQVDRRRHDLAAAHAGPADVRRRGLGRIGITVAPSDPRGCSPPSKPTRERRALPIG